MRGTATAPEQQINDISLILKDLLKVIKVVSMYPESNPLPQSLRRSFSEKLESIVDDYGDIRFVIEKDKMSYGNETVYIDKSKEERLAGIFFDTGITELTLKAGLDVEEIYKLLDILKSYINSSDKSIDLVALFWEQGISKVQFKTLEDVAFSDYNNNFDFKKYITHREDFESDQKGMIGLSQPQNYDGIFYNKNDDYDAEEGDPGSYVDDSDYGVEEAYIQDSKQGQTPSRQPVDGENAQINGSPNTIFFSSFASSQPEDANRESGEANVEEFNFSEAVSAMGYDDLPDAPQTQVVETTMILNDEFKLSKEEEREIKDILDADAVFEPYESTAELVMEMILQENDLTSFFESVTIAEKIVHEFVSQSHLMEASKILSFTQKLENKIRVKKGLWAERLKDARKSAVSAEKIPTLIASLNRNSDISDYELKKYLDNFGWEAVNNITAVIGQVENSAHRKVFNQFMTERGKDNVEMIAKGIFEKNKEAVFNSIDVLSKIADDKAMKYLDRATSFEQEEYRLFLAGVLLNCQHPHTIELLGKLAIDKISKIRSVAIKGLIKHRNERSFEIITEIINNDHFANYEPDEQSSLIIAFSQIGGDLAVPYLGQLAGSKYLFGGSRAKYFRQIAFDALAVNRSEKCEKLLLKLSGSWRPSIKEMAIETIKRRREYIYGG